MIGKTHWVYSGFETMCGKDFTNNPHRLKDKIEDVTCGTCKKIMLVFKSDSFNRPRKKVAKRVYTENNENYVKDSFVQPTNATNSESKACLS